MHNASRISRIIMYAVPKIQNLNNFINILRDYPITYLVVVVDNNFFINSEQSQVIYYCGCHNRTIRRILMRQFNLATFYYK